MDPQLELQPLFYAGAAFVVLPERVRAMKVVRRLARPSPMLIAVTDHAAERFRQRVRGTLEAKTEIARRVAQAHARGRVSAGERGALLIRDVERPDLTFVCRPGHDELVVITLWEEGEDAAVPRRFTDALRRDDHRVAPRRRDADPDH